MEMPIPCSGRAHIQGLIHDISSLQLSNLRLDSRTCTKQYISLRIPLHLPEVVMSFVYFVDVEHLRLNIKSSRTLAMLSSPDSSHSILP